MKYKNLPKYNEGMHFVTTKTYQNNAYFLDKTCCDILIEELEFLYEALFSYVTVSLLKSIRDWLSSSAVAELGIAIHSLPMDEFNGYEEKFVEKLEYIHNNQFQDKRIKNPENYLYSSMLFYEKEKGALKIDIV
ncbi:MAG: hypothetical protein PHE49_11975 [bacterium]|nr:hypothetical protein [bacterium]